MDLACNFLEVASIPLIQKNTTLTLSKKKKLLNEEEDRDIMLELWSILKDDRILGIEEFKGDIRRMSRGRVIRPYVCPSLKFEEVFYGTVKGKKKIQIHDSTMHGVLSLRGEKWFH